MPSLNGLSNPTVEVNDVVYAIKPNSLSYKTGYGEINLRTQSAGGDSVDVVATQNAETKMSMVKFSLPTTALNLDAVDGWLRQSQDANGNTIRLSDQGKTESFRGMKITSEPERNIGADGEIEVEFMGEPALR